MLSWSFVRVRICIPGDIFLVHVDVLCGRFLGRKAIPIIAWGKKRKGLMACIPSVIKTNWRSIYLWAISKFGLSIYIFFDGVAIWFGNELGRYVGMLWCMASQQWKHRERKKKNVFECINYLCAFLERAQMQSVRKPENGCMRFILFDWPLYEGWLWLLGHPVSETILIDLTVT